MSTVTSVLDEFPSVDELPCNDEEASGSAERAAATKDLRASADPEELPTVVAEPFAVV